MKIKDLCETIKRNQLEDYEIEAGYILDTDMIRFILVSPKPIQYTAYSPESTPSATTNVGHVVYLDVQTRMVYNINY